MQNRQREVKNSVGNGEAKELICMTHGHELREGNAGGNRGTWWREAKGRKRKSHNQIHLVETRNLKK